MIDSENEDPENESVKADPDAQGAERDFWNLTGSYIFGDHVFPRSTHHAPKKPFPAFRQTKTSLDLL